MGVEPKPESDDERRDAVLRRMLKTPRKPQKPQRHKPEPDGAKKS